ncbi:MULTISPECIES: energy transducer TonB [Deefgea]|uniref:TonB family protein n=1 Tax=Deefgea chitinilytica TaxID=570276 RepID=A0ABS2CAY8_9NEIS|nr:MULTISPECIES: energy transducer TonB [Deefgea]MBM5571314.1 TonB family protein [Deefgea chitinilytica]MBM9888546.1 energy transducer TonB [Deefgea sp. CFH1-16]
MILDNKKTLFLVMLAHVGVLHGVMTASPPKPVEAEPIVMLAMPVAMGEVAPKVEPAKPLVKVKQKVQQVKQKVQERRVAKSAAVVPEPAATPERVSTLEVAAAEKPQPAPQKDEGQGAASNKTVAATSGGGAQGQSTERNEAPTEPSFHANYLNNPKPRYPLQSRELGEKGVVYLRVAVNPQGLVDQVELHKSSGFPRLDQEAQNTVQRWRFVPAKRGEVAVAGTVIVPVVFSIKSS